MIYRDFKDLKLSLLGFGCMRLPLNEDGSIDTAEFQKMVDYAIEHGINYFDTAHPYHGGMSQIELGKALKKHPRDPSIWRPNIRDIRYVHHMIRPVSSRSS